MSNQLPPLSSSQSKQDSPSELPGPLPIRRFSSVPGAITKRAGNITRRLPPEFSNNSASAVGCPQFKLSDLPEPVHPHVPAIPDTDPYCWLERIYFLFSEEQLVELAVRALRHLQHNPFMVTFVPHMTPLHAALRSTFPSGFGDKVIVLRVCLTILLRHMGEACGAIPPLVVLRDRDYFLLEWIEDGLIRHFVFQVPVNLNSRNNNVHQYPALGKPKLQQLNSVHLLHGHIQKYIKDTFCVLPVLGPTPTNRQAQPCDLTTFLSAVKISLDNTLFLLQPELFAIAQDRWIPEYRAKERRLGIYIAQDKYDEELLEARQRKRPLDLNAFEDNLDDEPRMCKAPKDSPPTTEPKTIAEKDEDEVFL